MATEKLDSLEGDCSPMFYVTLGFRPGAGLLAGMQPDVSGIPLAIRPLLCLVIALANYDHIFKNHPPTSIFFDYLIFCEVF